MKNKQLTLVAAIAVSLTIVLSMCQTKSEVSEKPPLDSPVDYVSTLVGTLSKYSLSAGNTYPAIAMPWGSHFWTPQTGADGDGWIYSYTDDKIRGIKMTHQPSPWINDYGQFSIMPVTTGLVFDKEERASYFSHKSECAKPYYYSVYLADHDTFVELTPTEHSAKFRITYPEKELSYLVVDAFAGGSTVSVSGNRITGCSVQNGGGVEDGFKLWFVIESDTPFEFEQIVNGDHAHAIVGFRTTRGQKVGLNVSASFVSEEQAMVNLSEVNGKEFDSLMDEGKARWNEVLGRISVEDKDIDNLRTFYSCLYRCLLFPRDLSEVTSDGRRIHRSPYDGQVHDGYLYTDTGFWDTFRSLFALVNLVYPEEASKMQQGLVNSYLESGFLPEWASPGHRSCMVGNNSASVVAEAWIKGIRGQDIDVLWEAVCKGAHSVHPKVPSSGRLGWEYYDSLGYVPCDVGINESAARTLEYAYDDWCIWKLGKALGKTEAEIAPYALASTNYRNLYREDCGLMCGKNQDGSFPKQFNELKWGGDFTEGNALQYSWSVFHDPAGLADIMGGKQALASGLDRMLEMPPLFDESYYGFVVHEIREMQVMNMGNYAHGNQPVQHALYLYDWCGQPWKTQKYVREVMDRFYSATPDGYCGDEDNGQTSAWYVFSSLGFYPVCPASGEYAIGSPLFDKVTVNLPSGKTITITAKGNSRENVYVEKLKVNGRESSRNYLTHDLLVSGADISFRMSASPARDRGTTEEDSPYSFSNDASR